MISPLTVPLIEHGFGFTFLDYAEYFMRSNTLAYFSKKR
jgi:hypothetical protein